MSVLIVIPEEGKNSLDYTRTNIEFGKKHIDELNEYIKNKGIDLDPESSMYIQGVLMSMFGYCIVELASSNFNAFIPRTITKQQFDWFIENYEEISRYSISAELMDEDEGIIQLKDDSIHGVRALTRLYSLLEKRVVNEVKNNDVSRSK